VQKTKEGLDQAFLLGNVAVFCVYYKTKWLKVGPFLVWGHFCLAADILGTGRCPGHFFPCATVRLECAHCPGGEMMDLKTRFSFLCSACGASGQR
jgi:hypothetical protein